MLLKVSQSVITTCVKAGPQGGRKWATVCSGIGGSMSLDPKDVKVMIFLFLVCQKGIIMRLWGLSLVTRNPPQDEHSRWAEQPTEVILPNRQGPPCTSCIHYSFSFDVFCVSLVCNIYSARVSGGEFAPNTITPPPLEKRATNPSVSWVFFAAAAYIFITPPLKYHSC